jgi:hypothetical protein
MTFTINDLVVHPGTAPEDRLIRVVRIEPWLVVVNGGLIEDATARCHGTMIVFDRLVPTSPAPVDELRLATVEEINYARCQWPFVSPHPRPSFLPTDGHVFSPLVATNLPTIRLSVFRCVRSAV